MQGADHVGESLAGLIGDDVGAGGSDLLRDDGHSPLLRIEVTDGQRNPLALLVRADDQELARLGGCGEPRGLYLHPTDRRSQHLFGKDLIHSFQIYTKNPRIVRNAGIFLDSGSSPE